MESPVGMFPKEPLRFDLEELNRLLLWCFNLNVSDITIKTGESIFVKAQGLRFRVTHRILSTPEIGGLLNSFYGANGTSVLGSGVAIDTAHEVRPDRFTRLRFRVNASSINSEGGTGIEISLRTILSMPIELEKLNIEQAVLDAACPARGMVLITGETGSGKSTFLSALIRWRVEQEGAHLKILTGESPVEFVYTGLEMPDSIVTQTEIPRQIATFPLFIRSAMRRDPDIILVGESRDPETMAASIEAAITGHLLYTTLHSNGVPSTLSRVLSLLPPESRNSMAADVLESLQLIVTQRLLRTIDGKRTAVREYLVFDDEVRAIMLKTPLDKIPLVSRQLTQERGQTMEDHARQRYDEGIIDSKVLNSLLAHNKSVATDDEGS